MEQFIILDKKPFSLRAQCQIFVRFSKPKILHFDEKGVENVDKIQVIEKYHFAWMDSKFCIIFKSNNKRD